MESELKILSLEETGFNEFEDKSTGTCFQVPANRKLTLEEAQRLADEYQRKVPPEELKTEFYGRTHVLFPKEKIR